MLAEPYRTKIFVYRSLTFAAFAVVVAVFIVVVRAHFEPQLHRRAHRRSGHQRYLVEASRDKLVHALK